MESIVEDRGEILTLGHLQDAMNKHWRIDNGDDSDSSDIEEDNYGTIEITAIEITITITNFKKHRDYFKCIDEGVYAREHRICKGHNNKNNYENKNTEKGIDGINIGNWRNKIFNNKCHYYDKAAYKK